MIINCNLVILSYIVKNILSRLELHVRHANGHKVQFYNFIPIQQSDLNIGVLDIYNLLV